MSVPPTADDSAVAYTVADDVLAELPSNFAWAATATPCQTTAAQAAAMIIGYSRELDGHLASKFMVPFPASTATSPQCPDVVRRIVTYRVAARVRSRLLGGSYQAKTVQEYVKEADALEKGVCDKPSSMGFGRVTTPENVFLQAGQGTPYSEAGMLTGPWYRLKNRNLKINSLRFARSNGSEAFRSEGLPFCERMGDWAVINYAQSLIAIYNIGMITVACAALGGTGGVVYEFSWQRLDRGQPIPPILSGVLPR